MKTAVILLSLSALAATSTTPTPDPWQAEPPVLGTSTLHGCYSSNITVGISAGVMQFNSPGECGNACTKKSNKQYPVAALQGEQCWCGDKYPPKSTVVDTSECAEPCPGFARSACGNITPKRWTVLNTGVSLKVEDTEEGSVQSGSSTSVMGSATQSSTQSGGAAQTSSTAATTATGSPLPAAGAGRTVVGGAAVAAMGMGLLNFL